MANARALGRHSECLMAAIDATVRAIGGGRGVREVVTSSSLTALANLAAHRTAGYPWRHTVSPGTAALWDSGYDDAMPGAFECAAAVATRVVDVRRHRDTFVLTTDCGHKMGTSTDQGPAHVFGMRGYRPFGPSELFGRLVWLGFDRRTREPLEGDPQALLGHVVLVFPRHVCPTVNQYLLRAARAGRRRGGEGAHRRPRRLRVRRDPCRAPMPGLPQSAARVRPPHRAVPPPQAARRCLRPI